MNIKDKILEIRKIPELKRKKRVSIIIPAYKAEKHIEKCLDSIENQTFFKNNNNFEVVLGIDGCDQTLDKVLSIADKYRNLRIFNMESNMGMFVTLNTLLDVVTSEHIIRFDSDDIMCSDMISAIMYQEERNKTDKPKVIRFGYLDFNNNEESLLSHEYVWNKNKTFILGNGVIYFNKNILKYVGGYEPWICAADTDFYVRIEKSPIKAFLIDNYLFYRRIHENSLTQHEKTDRESDIRKEYVKKIIENHKNNIIFVNKVTNKYEEL